MFRIGKEVVVEYTSNLVTDGVFYTGKYFY